MWIDASSPEACVHSYSNIVQEITGISRSTSSVEHNIRLVERTLQQQKGKWLAVLDNFDDPKGFHEHNIQHYLPKAAGGAVSVTSRHASSQRLGHVIRVEEMSDDESLTLLLQRPSLEKTERQQGLSIAETLGRLALALDQAGAYIRARCLPLQDFESHYKKRKKVILAETPDQWEYRRKLRLTEGETALSVFVTWELSFALIRGDQEEVGKKDHFLTLAAHFSNQCVSQRYFKAYCDLKTADWVKLFLTNNEWDENRYRDVLAECNKLSLLQILDRPAEKAQFSLHPLVRDWLMVRKEQEKQGLYAEEYAILLAHYLEGVSSRDLDLRVKQETLLHVDASVKIDAEITGNSHRPILNNPKYSAAFAKCYWVSGRYDDAEKLYKIALTLTENKQRPLHPETLIRQLDLARILDIKGRYDEAEELCVFALVNTEDQLGPKHVSTLRAVECLAGIHADKQQHDSAESLYKRVLAEREMALGPDHTSTLLTVQNLAFLYLRKGSYDDAEKLCKCLLKSAEMRSNLPDGIQLDTLEDLARISYKNKRYGEAVGPYERVLAAREKKDGPDHPRTLLSAVGLANLYCATGRASDAERLYERGLAGYERIFGADHPDTFRIASYFAECLKYQGKIDEAKLLSDRFGL